MRDGRRWEEDGAGASVQEPLCARLEIQPPGEGEGAFHVACPCRCPGEHVVLRATRRSGCHRRLPLRFVALLPCLPAPCSPAVSWANVS